MTEQESTAEETASGRRDLKGGVMLGDDIFYLFYFILLKWTIFSFIILFYIKDDSFIM